MQAFANLIEALDNDVSGLPLHDIIDHVTAKTGLIEHHQSERGEKGQARVENLEELVNAARAFTHGDAFETPEAGEGMAALEAFYPKRHSTPAITKPKSSKTACS